MVNAIVFDLYDTLIYMVKKPIDFFRMFYELSDEKNSVKQLLRKYQTEKFSSIDEFVVKFGNKKNIDAPKYQKMVDESISSVRIFDDTLDTLDYLKNKGYAIGLISNLSEPYKKPFFEFGLDKYFDAVIFSCDAKSIKPEEKIYYKIEPKLNAKKDEITMIGDNPICDYKAPRLIGWKAILIDRKGKSKVADKISSLNVLKYYF